VFTYSYRLVDGLSVMHVKHSLIVVMCFLLLSGCGFKLRGAYKLPVEMQVTYIDAVQKNSTLTRALVRTLKASDIKVAENAADDIAVLKLSNESKTKRIVSVDASGRAREYTLTYAIDFHVTALTAKFEIEKQTISIDRDFQFDTEDVLGNSREESQLYEEMQQDLIRLILLRLQSKA